MRIVCVSDTHQYHSRLNIPDGDVLIHAGDLTMKGDYAAVRGVDAWLANLPHRHKIVIAGNHDFAFEGNRYAAKMLPHATYLEDSGVEIDGLLFWGSPWQPWFYDWAFNLQRGAEIAEKWALIPEGTSVLITHGPPHGILDEVTPGDHKGCEELRKRVDSLSSLRLHVFGHIHEGYGTCIVGTTTFVNAASCDREYKAANAPVVIDL